MIKRGDLGLMTLFCSLNKLVHFAKNSEKWCTQYKNDSTYWSPGENADLYKLMHFA